MRHVHNEYLLSHNEGGNYTIGRKMNGPVDHGVN